MTRGKLLLMHLFIPLFYGFLAGRITSAAVSNWYTLLNIPFFNPPPWVFGFVWIVLYLVMGFSAFLIDSGKSKKKEKALKFYWLQLIANFLWPLSFFWLRNPVLGFVEILVLWFLIYFTITKFFMISKTAGYLLLPYIAWVTFAATLNLAIIILN